MLDKIKHIILGWSRKFKIIKTEDKLKKLSRDRLDICSKCPFSKTSKALKFINGEFQEGSSLYCTKCKCPCEEKSLVNEETCPVGKW